MNKKYKIAVYAICKNEEKFVDRWIESMSEADIVVVTDTGSTDNTVSRLRELGAIVYEEQINPWRFDVARNKSLENVPEDVDICICTDLDEILNKGWRDILENQWEDDIKQGKYLYNWSLKEDGTPYVQFTYFKIHSRKDFAWRYPVHEIVGYIGKNKYREKFIDGLVLNHYPDNTKSRGSYLTLLELAVEENPMDDRMVYYLGREYMYNGKWDECIKTLNKHLKLPTATWAEERCAAMRWIAKSHARKGKIEQAYSWYYRAIAEVPQMRDAYVEFAQLGYSLKDWKKVYYMATEALLINKKSTCYVNQGYAWDHTPDDLASISAYYLGLHKESVEHAKNALKFKPEDERLKNNLIIVENKYKEVNRADE